MNARALPLIDLIEQSDPIFEHVLRFARDVAWRHRNVPADPARFRSALDGYYRAWCISTRGELPALEPAAIRAAVATYRNAHRARYRPKRGAHQAAA